MFREYQKFWKTNKNHRVVFDILEEWWVNYVAKVLDAVYVLHAFQKKTQKTSLQDIEIARKRLALIGVK